MEGIPDDLVDAVRDGACILFLGAMASAPAPPGSGFDYPEAQAPPSGTRLARHLARLSKYPDADEDNLQRVAIHFEFRDQTNRRSQLIQEVRKEACRDDFVPSPTQLIPGNRVVADVGSGSGGVFGQWPWWVWFLLILLVAILLILLIKKILKL